MCSTTQTHTHIHTHTHSRKQPQDLNPLVCAISGVQSGREWPPTCGGDWGWSRHQRGQQGQSKGPEGTVGRTRGPRSWYSEPCEDVSPGHSASPRLDSHFPQVSGEAFLHSVRQTPPFRPQGKPSRRPGILWNKLDPDGRVPALPLPGA